MIYQFSVFFLNLHDENNGNPFWALCGKIRPLVLNYPISFVLGSARCSSALCLFTISLYLYTSTENDVFSQPPLKPSESASQIEHHISTPHQGIKITTSIMVQGESTNTSSTSAPSTQPEDTQFPSLDLVTESRLAARRNKVLGLIIPMARYLQIFSTNLQTYLFLSLA